MAGHEGHFVEVAATQCPVCHGRAELAELVNDEENQIVSQFTMCRRCGTLPVTGCGPSYVGWDGTASEDGYGDLW